MSALRGRVLKEDRSPHSLTQALAPFRIVSTCVLPKLSFVFHTGFRQALIEHVSLREVAGTSARAGSHSQGPGSNEYTDESVTRPQRRAHRWDTSRSGHIDGTHLVRYIPGLFGISKGSPSVLFFSARP